MWGFDVRIRGLGVPPRRRCRPGTEARTWAWFRGSCFGLRVAGFASRVWGLVFSGWGLPARDGQVKGLRSVERLQIEQIEVVAIRQIREELRCEPVPGFGCVVLVCLCFFGGGLGCGV